MCNIPLQVVLTYTVRPDNHMLLFQWSNISGTISTCHNFSQLYHPLLVLRYVHDYLQYQRGTIGPFCLFTSFAIKYSSPLVAISFSLKGLTLRSSQSVSAEPCYQGCAFWCRRLGHLTLGTSSGQSIRIHASLR